jgi:hypothetical protein
LKVRIEAGPHVT